MNDLVYELPNDLGYLTVSGDALRHMLSHRQKGWFSSEAGGQLFASFAENHLLIVEATGPRKKDRRSRFSFLPHRPSEQKEISERYKRSQLHYVGDWHTHPEQKPHPSRRDTDSVAEIFSSSNHDLFGVLLIVVGTGDPPTGLYVGLHARDGLHELRAV